MAEFESENAYLAKSLFLQGSFSACIATVRSESSPAVQLQLYGVRSQLALSQNAEAMKWLSSLPESDLSVQAVSLLAQYLANGDSVVDDLRDLLAIVDEDDSTQAALRPVAGTVMYLEGESAEALTVLAEGVKNKEQECVALQVQILLSLDQFSAAKQVYSQAKMWAEDSLVIQLCEAWIGLRTGGPAYQSAFYVFDEIAQLPSANNTSVLNGKAVAQAAMGHWPEAEAALSEALQVNAQHADSIANTIALLLPSGKPISSSEQSLQRLASIAPSHPLLADLAAKSAMFDESSARFAAPA